MKIGDLASTTGIPVETIRFYERVGLLPAPQRTAGNYRMYESTHAERLLFIRNCRALDLTLDDVRELLASRDDPKNHCNLNHLLDEQIAHVGRRIAELKGLEETLRELRRQCDDAHKSSECEAMTGLAAVSAGLPKSKSNISRPRKV